jgi:hypothetical protein
MLVPDHVLIFNPTAVDCGELDQRLSHNADVLQDVAFVGSRWRALLLWCHLLYVFHNDLCGELTLTLWHMHSIHAHLNPLFSFFFLVTFGHLLCFSFS